MNIKNENRPGYKKTKIGWIPEEWESPAIGDTLKFSRYGCNTPTTEDGNILVVGMKNLQNGEIQLTDLGRVALSNEEQQKFMLKRDDVLINRTNSYDLVGKVGIFDSDDEVAFVSYLVLLSGNQDYIRQKYLNYWLNSYPSQKSIKCIATKGVSQANINPTEFKKHCYIPLPSLPEQQAIAGVLECWDKGIKNLELRIEKKRNIKKGLMQKLLSGKQRLPGFSEDWKEVMLGKVGTVVTGNTPPKKDSSNYGDKYCWATAEDFLEKYITDTNRKLSEQGKNQARMIPKDSVLVTSIASIGLNAIAGVPLATNQQINTIIVDAKNFSNEFVYYLISKNKQLLQRAAGSGAVPILSKGEFEKIKMNLPSLSEQIAIAAVLSAADLEIETLERKLALLKDQKKFLLNNLVMGTLRLPKFRDARTTTGTSGENV